METKFRIRETWTSGVKYFIGEVFVEYQKGKYSIKEWRNVNTSHECYLTYDQAKNSILDYIEELRKPKDIIHELPELTIPDTEYRSLQEDFLSKNPEIAEKLGYKRKEDPRPDICKCCGDKMKPLNDPEYLCRNPFCDNYVKVIKPE